MVASIIILNNVSMVLNTFLKAYNIYKEDLYP